MVTLQQSCKFPFKFHKYNTRIENKSETNFPITGWLVFRLHLPKKKLGCEMDSQVLATLSQRTALEFNCAARSHIAQKLYTGQNFTQICIIAHTPGTCSVLCPVLIQSQWRSMFIPLPSVGISSVDENELSTRRKLQRLFWVKWQRALGENELEYMFLIRFALPSTLAKDVLFSLIKGSKNLSWFLGKPGTHL